MMWRRLFVVLMVFSLFDGFISNWQTGNPLALLYKDFLLIIVFIMFLLSENFKYIVQELGKFLGGFLLFFALAFVFIAIAQIFNPYAPGLELGILGLKLYFLYWLLVPMAYAYADSVEKILGLLKVIGIASIFVNLFALQQFFYGPGWVISTFGPGFLHSFREAALDQAQVVGPIKSFYRVIGTFASTGQYSNFLQANIIFCFPLIFTSQTRNQKFFWYGVQILNFIGLLAAGSRGSILFTLFQIGLMAFLFRRKRSFGGMAIIAVIGFGIGLTFMGEGVRARFSTIKRVDLLRDRTVDTTSKIFSSNIDKYPLGRGIGFASTAARHLNPLMRFQKETWVENYPTKLQLEVGIPGVVLFFLFLAILLKRWWFDWLSAFTRDTWDIGLPLSTYGLAYAGLLSLFGILETTPGALFVCVVMGLVLRLIDLSRPQETSSSDEYPSRYS